jgi:hypothetical protein
MHQPPTQPNQKQPNSSSKPLAMKLAAVGCRPRTEIPSIPKPKPHGHHRHPQEKRPRTPCSLPKTKNGKAEPQNALPKPTQTQPASQEVKKHQKNINKKVLSGSGAR